MQWGSCIIGSMHFLESCYCNPLFSNFITFLYKKNKKSRLSGGLMVVVGFGCMVVGGGFQLGVDKDSGS